MTIDTINKDFLDKYFRKIHVLHNLKFLMNKNNIDIYDGVDDFKLIKLTFIKQKNKNKLI